MLTFNYMTEFRELRHPHTFNTLHDDRVEAMARVAAELGQPALGELIQFDNQPNNAVSGMTHQGKYAYQPGEGQPVSLLSIDLEPSNDEGEFGPASHTRLLRITENMADGQGELVQIDKTYAIPPEYQLDRVPRFRADAWDAERSQMSIYDIGTADPATLPKDMKQLYDKFGRKLSIVEDMEPGSATEPATLKDILGKNSAKSDPAPVASSRYLEGERYGGAEVLGVDTKTARDMRVALDYELAFEVNDRGERAARVATKGLHARIMRSGARMARSLQAAADARTEALSRLDVSAISERLRNHQ